MHGRRALITGASRGIGWSLAHAFAREGVRVAAVARSRDAIERLASEIGGDAYACDLADHDAVASLFETVERDGPVDLLVNNAGVDLTGRFADASADDVAMLLQVNLLAPVELSRQAVQRMLPRRRGHIVNISSLAATVPFPGLAAYGASKAGLSRFTAGLRSELRGTGIGTTLVELGGVRTEMVEHTREYAPTRRSWRRVERLRLSVDVEPDAVARQVVRAVQRGTSFLCLPRRATPYPLVAHAPWYVTDVLLAGVDRHSVDPDDRHRP